MKSTDKIKRFLYYFRFIAIFFIILYQRLFSPDHSFWSKHFFPHGYCKFSPSCSEYGKQAFKKHGLIVGSIKTTWRILRCNPWSEGGVDEV